MCCLSFEGPQWIVTQCHIFRGILSSTKHFLLQQEAQISIPDVHADLTTQKPAASAEKPAAHVETPTAPVETSTASHSHSTNQLEFPSIPSTCFILATAMRLNHGGTTLFSG
eukprot:151025_1